MANDKFVCEKCDFSTNDYDEAKQHESDMREFNYGGHTIVEQKDSE